MKACLVFRYRDKGQTEPVETAVFDKILAKNFPECSFTNVSQFKDFESECKTEKFDLVVFDWTTYLGPSHVVESYFRSKHCRAPLLVYLGPCTGGVKTFLSEFDITEVVEVKDPKIELAYDGLVKRMQEISNPTTMATKVRLAIVRMNYYLNNGQIEPAQELFGKLRKSLGTQAQGYLEAQILDQQNQRDKAIARIISEPVKTVKLIDLLGTLLFLKNDHKRALTALTRAREFSPLNLKRISMISMCQEGLSDGNPEMKVAAMTSLLTLKKICPTYPGVTGKIVQMVIASEDVTKIPIVNELLLRLDNSEIMKIYKKIDTFSEPFRTAFTDVFISAMSKITNEMILQDDLNALKYYKYIGKLLPDNDQRRLALDYCLGRAYFRFGQLDMAQTINDQVLQASNGAYDKAVALGKLITKAKNGEFDVLLDDEKDWLIAKKAS